MKKNKNLSKQRNEKKLDKATSGHMAACWVVSRKANLISQWQGRRQKGFGCPGYIEIRLSILMMGGLPSLLCLSVCQA